METATQVARKMVKAHKMAETHEHTWIYSGSVCCGYRLECTGCSRTTKVRDVEGSPNIGDPMRLDEKADVGARIGTKVRG